ncbi:hypothetical protein KXS11_02775 [Plantibacter flavus]|uniref:hypothetical protein n=1 Tax=Plantibacter flavus TaxID=150123 RepID=UPI003F1513E8
MSIDLVTMLVVSVVVCAGCGVFYALDSARTLAGRHMAAWLSGFASTLLSSVCYLAASYTDNTVWIVAIANAGMVAALAAVWVGCRLFNGRAGLVAVGTFLVGVTAIAAVVDPTDDAEWAGSIAKFVCLILLSVLIVRESLRDRLRTAPPSKVLVVVLSVHTVFTLARLVVFATIGHHSEIFERVFSSAIVTNMNLLFIVAVAVGLVLLRSWERKQRLAPERVEIRAVGRREFDQAATRSRELLPDDRRFAIMEVGIDGFSDLRRAYGLASAGELEALLTEIVYGVLPPESVCMRVRNGIVVVATSTVAGRDDAAELSALAVPIASAYRAAVSGQIDGFAGTTRLGIAVDGGAPIAIGTLTRAASAARDQAELRGEGARVVHPANGSDITV